jgi:hypothetical protein
MKVLYLCDLCGKQIEDMSRDLSRLRVSHTTFRFTYNSTRPTLPDSVWGDPGPGLIEVHGHEACTFRVRKELEAAFEKAKDTFR